MEYIVHNQKFAALLGICEVIEQALDLERTLENILGILSDQLSMQRATITLYDPETGQLSINASHGLSLEEKKRGVYNLNEGITGRIFQTAQPYIVPDIRKEPHFLNKTGSRSISKSAISFLGVPILMHGEVVGVLNVDRLFTEEISYEEDIEFLKIVATLIAQFTSLNEKVIKREARLKQENVSLKNQISRENDGLYMVGKSSAMLEVQQTMEKVAPTSATVILLGESGVGKSHIAKNIHQLSDRSNYPFIKVDCTSIPENLLESELFGYEKGAFTGAYQSRQGRFEEADKGTIFLDEVGELPYSIQTKLLRVLQDKEFERLGSNKTVKIDVRVLAATNKDLEELTSRGEFRLDLYYRLNVFPIWVPPLRERRDDIPELLNHFLIKVSKKYSRKLHFTPNALEMLINYSWPGNVREIENLMERVVIMSEGERIDADLIRSYLHPPGHKQEKSLSRAMEAPQEEASNSSLEQMEKKEVLAALERNFWIQSKAARDLGLTKRQMGYRIKKFELEETVERRKRESKHQNWASS